MRTWNEQIPCSKVDVAYIKQCEMNPWDLSFMHRSSFFVFGLTHVRFAKERKEFTIQSRLPCPLPYHFSL